MQQGTTTTAILALERLQGRVRRRVLGRGLLGWAAVAAPAATVAVWAAGAESMRAGFIAAGLTFGLLALLAAAAVRLVWRPWRRHADRGAFAATVETRFPFGNLVVAAEESARKPERWPDGDAVARELARRLDAGAQSALASLTPAHIDPDRHSTRRLFVLAAGIAAGIALIAFQPATTVRGLLMLTRPFGSAGTRPATALVAEPSAPWVVAGGSITLAAIDYATESSLAHAEVRFGDAAWSKLAAEPVAMAATATASADPAVAAGSGTAGTPRRRWSITLNDVREDFSWRFRRGETSTSIGMVVVRHPPLLAGLSARITPPAYMGLPAMNVDRLPALSEVPAGSRVSLSGRAGGGRTDGDLAAAWLQTAVGDSLPMAVAGNVVTIDLSVTREISFTVGLRDRYGLASHGPLGYRLAVLDDQRPAVTLVRPQDDGLLPLDGRVSLLVEATDDFGLKRLDLLAKAGGNVPEDATLTDRAVFGPRASGQWQTLRTAAGDLRWRARELEPGSAPLRAVLALEIEAGDLELVPGDALELAVEARDNHAPGEGQTTRSTVLRLALPSAADVLAEQAESAEQGRQALEEAKRRGRQLDADLERLARELMKNPVPDWARQQEIEAALERQQALQRELARVAEELRRQMEQLAGGKLTSEAQLERAEQLAQLLAPPEAGKLAELLAKLEQPGGQMAPDQVAPDQVARALDEVAQAQKDLERRLDAALATMKRMADEQRFEGLTSLLEDMMRRQQELAELSRDLEGQDGEMPDGDRREGEQGDPSPSAEELARRQEALAKELEQLREKLEEALAEQRASAGDPKDEQGDTGEQGEKGEQGEQGEMSPQEQALREALEKLKQQQSSGSMGKASEMLQKMDPAQAAQMQQQALRDLGSLYSVLLASQQAMQAAMKMEQMSSLRGLAADLLALSARQEELGARIPIQLQDVRNVELTRQQHRLQKAAIGTRDRLAGLLEEAPNRILKLLEKMDDLVELMGGGVRALDEGRAAAAREQSGRSLAESNRIVIGLLTEAQMAGGGGGGGGGQQQSASEQLQELARRQAELNGATEELRRMLADRGISQQTRSQMQRLGQQQGALGQELAKLTERERERPAGEGARLLGDMEELGSQMERVGDDLGAGQVDQEVLLRQDRILGRLLDARNSVRERDYSSRRESRSALRPFDPQTGSDGRSGAAGDAPALQRYQRLEDAPLEYRELVRRYFAAIDSLQRAMPGTREGVLP